MQSKTQLNQLKLKPCPFCGSRAVLKWAEHDGLEYSSASCGQVGTCPASGGFSPQQSRQQAIEKWNRRVAQAEATELAKALDGMIEAADLASWGGYFPGAAITRAVEVLAAYRKRGEA